MAEFWDVTIEYRDGSRKIEYGVSTERAQELEGEFKTNPQVLTTESVPASGR